MEYTARIHHEDGTYWAEIPDLPGVFASGDTVDELLEALKEAVALYLGEDEPGTAELSELKLALPA
jgi:predicted RNase H-like HicB family nuclease